MKACYYLLLPIFILCSLRTTAQLSLTQIGTSATMNFDIPGSSACSGTLGWTDNVTIPNCYTNRSVYAYSNGCNNTGAVHVAGSGGETALGGRASNSTSLIQWGVRIANNTGQAITSLHVKYHAEQWSSAQSGGASNTVTFAYAVSSTPITSLAAAGSYTSFPSLNMTSFVSQGSCGGSTTAINGNDPANAAWLEACIPVNIPAGGEIMLRWNDPNNPCNDHMMCIDDLTVTPLSGTISITTNSPVCAGDTVHLAPFPAIDGATYTITGPNGFTSPTADTFITPAQPIQSGTYNITATLSTCTIQTGSVAVVVNNPVTTTIDTAICQGMQYTFGSNVYSAPGTYSLSDTFTTVTGCDSILHLNLVIHNIIRDTTATAICMGTTYSFNGVTYTTAGFYSDTLISGTGCDSISILHLTINPVYNLPVTATICYGLSYSWAGSSYTTTGSYPHTFATIAGCDSTVTLFLNVLPPLTTTLNDSSCIGTEYIVGAHHYTTTGQYIDTLTASTGCDSVITLNLFVKPLPQPPATVDVHYCQFDSPTVLTAQGQSLRWYDDNGNIPAPTPPTGQAAITTWYVTQTQDGCESHRAPLTVTVITTPTAAIAATKNPVCSSDSIVVVYTGNGTAAMLYNWLAPDAVISGNNTIGPVAVFPSGAGAQAVSLQVDNQGCKSNVATTSIEVLPALLVSAALPAQVCVGQPAVIALNQSDATANATYTWDFDGGNAIGDNGIPHLVTWNSTGTRHITLDALYKGCPSNQWQGNIEVDPLPDVAIDRTNIPASLCSYDTVSFAITGEALYHYSWAPAAFVTGDTSKQGTTRIVIPGATTVTVTATNQYGCTSADSVFIASGPCCELSLPNAFTPNGDGRNDVFRTITEGNHQIIFFRVMNRWGQSVFETENESQGWNGAFNGVPQDAGTYYYAIRYKCSNGNIYDKTGDLLLIR